MEHFLAASPPTFARLPSTPPRGKAARPAAPPSCLSPQQPQEPPPPSCLSQQRHQKIPCVQLELFGGQVLEKQEPPWRKSQRLTKQPHVEQQEQEQPTLEHQEQVQPKGEQQKKVEREMWSWERSQMETVQSWDEPPPFPSWDEAPAPFPDTSSNPFAGIEFSDPRSDQPWDPWSGQPWEQEQQQQVQEQAQWCKQEEEQAQSCKQEEEEMFIPKRKVEQALKMGTKPKAPPRPVGTAEFPREVNSRKSADRNDLRKLAWAEQGVPVGKMFPWDCRGPPGPKQGGPQTWKGQRFRENTGRWANCGGQFKEMYALYRKKVAVGLQGKELHYWHPYAKGGHWEKEMWERGELAPWEVKQAKEDAKVKNKQPGAAEKKSRSM